MNRYQLYLDPQTVTTLDDLSRVIDVSRSRLIRDVLDRIASEYRKVLQATTMVAVSRHPLLRMEGIGQSPTGRVAEDHNDIYRSAA